MKIRESCSSVNIFWGVCLSVLVWMAVPAESDKAMASLTNQQQKKMVQEIYTKYKNCFPDIPGVTPEEAMQLLKEDQAVLVDVRPAVERCVSQLPGAITANDFLQCPDSHPGKTVIAYDTVGYRSGLFVEKLRGHGLCLVNLEGGLLGWLHAGGKIYDANGCETRRVHVYNCMWNYAPSGFETLR
jgi:rhodanese-related sulfurtransferase